MCRFVAYLGRPITLDTVLFHPKNSLVKQSIHAREAEEPLNGDGFGLGWYNLEISPEPALFTSIQPAWNDRNLLYITPKIFSNCFMAHIRAASAGGVSIYNCHPFHYDRFLFMHNGGIGGFQKLKRHIRHELSDPVYDWIKGQTDSEHLAALFIEHFLREKAHHTIDDMAKVFIKTLKELFRLSKEYGITEPSYINYVITDGQRILASRYTNDETKYISSLHYATGLEFSCAGGVCHLPQVGSGQRNGAVLVSSEKLDSHKADWKDVPPNHLLLIDEDLGVRIEPIIL